MNPTDEFKAAGEAEVEPDFLETVMRRVREAEVRRRKGRRAVVLLAVTLVAGLAVRCPGSAGAGQPRREIRSHDRSGASHGARALLLQTSALSA